LLRPPPPLAVAPVATPELEVAVLAYRQLRLFVAPVFEAAALAVNLLVQPLYLIGAQPRERHDPVRSLDDVHGVELDVAEVVEQLYRLLRRLTRAEALRPQHQRARLGE